MQPKSIKFFTTAGCHLCEQAYNMLQYLISTDTNIKKSIKLKSIDVADEDSLMDKYGTRIPVLASPKNELGWPFELEELREWLLD